MSHSYDEALHLKASFVALGKEMRGMLASGAVAVTKQDRPNIEGLMWIARHAAVAEPFWVASEMVALLHVAATKMPQQRLLATDLPCPHGVVAFAEPVAGVRGLMWSELADTGIIIHTQLDDSGTGLETAYVWRFGHTPKESTEGFADLRSRSDSTVDQDRLGLLNRYLSTFWTLSQQRLATPSRELGSRAARRRLERLGLSEIANVRVVRLRRVGPQQSADGSLSVVWSHRWMVSGHWRNQWLPSLKAHRLQWIAPYVKGPDDKPLVVKDTVKAWVR